MRHLLTSLIASRPLPHPHIIHYPARLSGVVPRKLFPYGIDRSPIRSQIWWQQNCSMDERMMHHEPDNRPPQACILMYNMDTIRLYPHAIAILRKKHVSQLVPRKLECFSVALQPRRITVLPRQNLSAPCMFPAFS